MSLACFTQRCDSAKLVEMMQLLDAVGALCNLADKPDALARLIQDPTCVDSGGEAIHWEKANTQA